MKDIMKRPIDILLLSIIMLSAAFYFYGIWDRPFIVFSSNILFPICGLIAAALGFHISGKYGIKSLMGAAFFSYAVGLLIWTIGEVVWAVYVLAYGVEIPFPSLADVFYVVGYIPLFMGFAFFMRVFREILSERKVIVPSIVSGLAILLLVSATVIPESVSQSSTILEEVLAIAYPLLDSVLVTFATISFIVFFGGKLMYGWLYVLLGYLLLGAVDVLYYYYDLLGLVWEGHPLEIVWLASYIFLAKGFHKLWIEHEVK